MYHFRLALLFCCLVLVSTAQSFEFTVNGQPTQCGSLSVSWTGGQAPFHLVIVRPGFVSPEIHIPNSSFRDNNGLFVISALPVLENMPFFLAMSDSTGAMSGGTSNLMTAGGSSGEQSCNTTTPANDFFFSTPEIGPIQCGDFAFTLFEGAIKPLTIFAFIPGGSDSFIVPPSPPNATSVNWKANISALTQVTFSAIDSQGRFGGTDKMRTVLPSGDLDDSCLLNTPSPTGSPGDPTRDKKTNILPGGMIAGLVVGGTMVIIILATLLYWLRRRHRQSKPISNTSVNLAKAFPQDPGLSYSMLSRRFAPSPFTSLYTPQGIDNSITPLYPGPLRPPLLLPLRAHSQHYDESSSSLSTAVNNSQPDSQTRIALHHNVDEAEGPVGLPPQYFDRQTPIHNLQTSPLQYGRQTKTG